MLKEPITEENRQWIESISQLTKLKSHKCFESRNQQLMVAIQAKLSIVNKNSCVSWNGMKYGIKSMPNIYCKHLEGNEKIGSERVSSRRHSANEHMQ